MTFSQYRDSLKAKKYDSLPFDEVNRMVINNENLDQVANSFQRMALRVVSKLYNFNHTSDEVLFEAIQICNLAIAEAMHIYTQEKIDFAGFVYVHMQNFIISHLRTDSTIKPSVVKGERQFPSYFYIDSPNEDDNTFDIPFHQSELEDAQIDKEMLLRIIREENHKFLDKHMDIFLQWVYKDEGVTNRQVAKDNDMSAQLVEYIVKKTRKEILGNKRALEYVSLFMPIYE